MMQGRCEDTVKTLRGCSEDAKYKNATENLVLMTKDYCIDMQLM